MDDGYGQRENVELRLTELPAGPVEMWFVVQVPLAQLPLLDRVAVLPRAPVTVCFDEHVPLLHDPDPVELAVPPRGPVPLPERVSAWAEETLAAIKMAAMATEAMVFMGSLLG